LDKFKTGIAVQSPREKFKRDETRKGSAPLKEVEVATLLETAREVVLLHEGERYRLRITASGKLILTK